MESSLENQKEAKNCSVTSEAVPEVVPVLPTSSFCESKIQELLHNSRKFSEQRRLQRQERKLKSGITVTFPDNLHTDTDSVSVANSDRTSTSYSDATSVDLVNPTTRIRRKGRSRNSVLLLHKIPPPGFEAKQFDSIADTDECSLTQREFAPKRITLPANHELKPPPKRSPKLSDAALKSVTKQLSDPKLRQRNMGITNSSFRRALDQTDLERKMQLLQVRSLYLLDQVCTVTMQLEKERTDEQNRQMQLQAEALIQERAKMKYNFVAEHEELERNCHEIAAKLELLEVLFHDQGVVQFADDEALISHPIDSKSAQSMDDSEQSCTISKTSHSSVTDSISVASAFKQDDCV